MKKGYGFESDVRDDAGRMVISPNITDAGIIIFPNIHPQYSHARKSGDEATEAAEKRPLPKKAITGFYYYRKSLTDTVNAVLRFPGANNDKYNVKTKEGGKSGQGEKTQWNNICP